MSDSLDHGRHLMFTGERAVSDAFDGTDNGGFIRDDATFALDGHDAGVVRTEPLGGMDYEAWTTFAFPTTTQPNALLNADPKRKSAKISNIGAGPVVVGKLSQVATGNGFTLPAGKDLDLNVTAELYVACAAGNTTPTPVCVLTILGY